MVRSIFKEVENTKRKKMLQTLDVMLHSKYFWTVAALTVIYIYLKFFIYAYWRKHRVPHETPIIPFGNILPIILGEMQLGNFIKRNYKKSREHRFYGIYVFNRPLLVINDSELIHEILIKEFHKFNSRGIYHNEKIDPLTNNLFHGSGENWKKLRIKMSPIFKPSKLKEMIPFIKEISDELIKICDQLLVNNDTVEIKDLLSRYTIDIISSIAFGFNCKSLDDPESEFKRYGDMAFNRPRIKTLIGLYASVIFDILRMPYFRKDMTRFFSKKFEDAVKFRRQSKISRIKLDFLNILIQMMDEGELNDTANRNQISMIEAQGQAFILFLGGFETTSSTITFLLYELALNPEIQAKAHEEIDEFLAKGELTYNRIQNELKYLDMVLSETMRKYPTFSIINRLCNEDYQIPNSDFTIKKGTAVIIPVFGLHYDPDFYPDPEKFDPNRFLNNNHNSIQNSCIYLPFGNGPRYCLGSRLAMLQLKFGLIALLSNYTFSKCNKTRIPIEFSGRSFTQSPGCDVYLRLEKRVKEC